MKANRFRFRAWVRDHGEMYYSSNTDGDLRFFFSIDDGTIRGFQIEDGYEDDGAGGQYPVGQALEIADPIMQSTGLTDKNGVEIFEADCLRYHTSPVYQVVWQRHGWGLAYRHKGNGGVIGVSERNGFLEVIGNIYENPELLAEDAQ